MEPKFYLCTSLFIKTTAGKSVLLFVNRHDTIQSIKSKIQRKQGISSDRQSLIFAGKQLKDDTKTLCDYNIDSSATMYLFESNKIHKKHIPKKYIPPEKIFIKMLDGTKFTLYVESEDTIESIKCMIQDQEGIPPGRQRLYILAGAALKDYQTLKQLHVSHEATLLLVLRSFQVEVNVEAVLPLLKDQKKVRVIKPNFRSTLNSISVMLGLSNISNAIKWYGNGSEVIPAYLYKIPLNRLPIRYNGRHFHLKLDFDQLPVNEIMLCLEDKFSKMKGNIDATLEFIEKAQNTNDDLNSSIKRFEKFKQLRQFLSGQSTSISFYKQKIADRSKIYQKELMCLNDMIVKTKQKSSKKKILLKIFAFEKQVYEMDIHVADTLKDWDNELVNMAKSNREVLEHREHELKQMYQLWTLNDFIGYLNYANDSKIQFGKKTIEKFKLIGLNGSTISDINDSLLILSGITDPSKRKLIIDITKDLLNNYGGIESKEMCCICVMNEVNTVCVPCGHLVYCNECGKKSFQHTNKCPICRKDVITLVTTFKSGMQ